MSSTIAPPQNNYILDHEGYLSLEALQYKIKKLHKVSSQTQDHTKKSSLIQNPAVQVYHDSNTSFKDEYPLWQQKLQIICLISFAILATIQFIIIAQFKELSIPAFTTFTILAVLTVDFLSGLIHWTADTWGYSSWPVIGPSLLKAFRLHHLDEKGITRHDFKGTNGEVAFVIVPIQITTLILLLTNTINSLFFTYLSLVAIIGISTNQLHKWAHQDNTNNIIKWLQKHQFILSKRQHQIHHKYPHTKSYCITFGYLNPLLDKIKFWRYLETAITKLTGAKPRDEDLTLLKT